MKVAVVAHVEKGPGGGLVELEEILAREGCIDPIWYEVSVSRRAPRYASRSVARGAEVVFVWGGDGMVQRCIDALVETDAVIAILPVGKSNLLAANLAIPTDLTEAVRVGLYGDRRLIDTGSINGEHFAVMAGTGLEAFVIKESGSKSKGRIGRLAYFYSGSKNLSARRAKARIEVDGKRFFKGKISCILIGNVSKGQGGVEVFSQAQPDDGLLELAVVTTKNSAEWARTLRRTTGSITEESRLAEMTRGKEFQIRFDRRFAYEIDGNSRDSVKKLKIKVHPSSIKICVPTFGVSEAAAGGERSRRST